MSFLRLFQREMRTSTAKMAVMSGLGGASNAIILAMVNTGAQSAAGGTVSLSSAMTFIVALIVYIKTQHYLMTVSTAEIEAVIHKIRVQLLDQVRHSELVQLEDVGRATMVSVITKETSALSQVTPVLALTTQAVVLVFFVGIYIAWLSTLAFLLSVVIIGLASMLYVVKNRQVNLRRREAFQWEGQFFDRMSDLLNGFKEARLHRPRSNDLFDDVAEVSRMAANIKIRAQTDILKQAVFSQTSFYVLLAALTFVVPAFNPSMGASVVKTTTAVLFVIGACWGIVQSAPILSAANAAADNIQELSAKLAATSDRTPAAEQQAVFSTIAVRDVVFRYIDKWSQTEFQLGPVNFDLNAGEMVFITGGNGSGKSTLLKLLSSLYIPDSGRILMDGKAINETSREDYRALISAIFSDYHLFHRIYGIVSPDPAEISDLLGQLGLADKTGITDGAFRTIDLSAGQRKRLALVVTLLENRPILLLDEWTADQDAEYRKKFYNVVLPMLHRRGKTVVMVTHDEDYLETLPFPVRRVRMADGRIVEQHVTMEKQ